MLPNLKAEMTRQKITCDKVGEAIGRKSEWVESRIQGKTNMPVDTAIEIRKKFFPELPFEYLFSKEPIIPIIKEKNKTA